MRDSTPLKAIETRYKGYRFRSRLEARWAVFFDALGVRYEYEPEGFKLSSGEQYLPDFWLPDTYFRWNHTPGLWFEVKGVLTPRDDQLIEQFARDSEQPICIAPGAYFSDYRNIADIQHYLCGRDEDDIWWDEGLIFMRCRQCRKVRIQFYESSYADCEFCQTESEFVVEDHPAYLAARSARFEFGESG